MSKGHEFFVLQGGQRTLAASRPNLLVEVQDRTRPGALAAVFGMLGGLGYQGDSGATDRSTPPDADVAGRLYWNGKIVGRQNGQVRQLSRSKRSLLAIFC